MKGVVFEEFIDMVDDLFGIEMTETIISNCNLPSKGSYTTVGTYDDSEMIDLVTELNAQTKIPVPDLLKTFGKHLFAGFAKKYKDMIKDIDDSFMMLKHVEDYIHVEVKKLYPEANLPTFSYKEESSKKFIFNYYSSRKMPDLAEGLIEANMLHFKDDFTITRNVIKEDNSHVEFIIERK